MNGLKKTNDLTREEVLAAIRAISPENDYVWDGIDEDNRPLTAEEMEVGHQAYLKRMKEEQVSISLSLSRNVIDSFRSTGQDWQKRINDVLLEYIATHSL